MGIISTIMARVKRKGYSQNLLLQKGKRIMYDIHCHLLPGVDDGPLDMDESLNLCRITADEGIKVVIATPHYAFHNSKPLQSLLLSEIFLINHNLMEEGIELTVLPGMEVPLIPELPELYAQGMVMTINLKNYLLVELPFNGSLPIFIHDTLFKLQVKGIKPIIAHPERCAGIMVDPNIVSNLIEIGCLMQVNAGSINGLFGSRVKKTALTLLKHNMVHVIASDNHSPYRRISSLEQGYSTVKKILGENSARALFTDNPRKIINGEEVLVEQPTRINI